MSFCFVCLNLRLILKKCLSISLYVYVHIHTLDRSTQIIETFSHSFHPGRCTAAGYRRTRCRSRCTKPAALFLWGYPYMLCRRCRIYNTDTGMFSLKSASKVNFTTLSGHVVTIKLQCRVDIQCSLFIYLSQHVVIFLGSCRECIIQAFILKK